MSTVDLEPAARRMAALIGGISDDMLDRPTPCPEYLLGDLVDHVGRLAMAFTMAAAKDHGDAGGQGPVGDASCLAADWCIAIPRDVVALAAAWREPDAWTGLTRAGWVDMPGEVAGVVALDELVIHGWDVARAAGQPYVCDDETLAVVHDFVAPFSVPGHEADREGLFGPVVDVPEGAPLLDRVLGMTGRDPAWTAP